MRKDFLEMTYKDLKEIGLAPMRSINAVRAITLGNVFVYKYRRSGSIGARSEKANNEYNEFLGEFEKTDFLDMSEEFFKNKLQFTDAMTAKYLWLQKYIKGEVDGEYTRENDENLINLKIKEAAKEKDKKIEKLKNKIADLNNELSAIGEENRELKVKLKQYEKFKKLHEEISKIQL